MLLVLDTGRTSAGRVGDAPRLDAAMDAALLLAALATRAGDRVDLLAYDRRTRIVVERPPSTETLPQLVNAMANLEPELLETDHRGLVVEVLRRAGRHSFVVLFTGLDAGPVEDGLLPVLGQLTHRHTVLVAAVADPRLAEMARARGDTAAVYGAAAASMTGAPGHGCHACSSATVLTSSTRCRTNCLQPSQTPTSRSRPPVGCDCSGPVTLARDQWYSAGLSSGDGQLVTAVGRGEISRLAGLRGAAAVDPDIGEERDLGRNTDGDPGPCREARGCDERLDHP